MRLWWALLFAEAIKARRSAPVRLALAAPVVLFLLEILSLFARHQINQTNPVVLWQDFLTFSWVFWLGLFTPVLIVLETVCLTNVEHSGKHWKQLFALPVARWKLFTVKMLFCGALLSVSFTVFTLTSVGGVLIFSGVRGLNLARSIPWVDILPTTVLAFVACWLLIVVHTWISVRFPGFTVPAGAAFTAMLVGFPLVNMNRDIFAWWYPWTLPFSVRPGGFYDSHVALAPALFGAIAGIVLAPLASWDLGRRQEGV